MNIAVLLMCACAAYAQNTGADQTGGITGIVTDAVTHLPVKKAMVSANPNFPQINNASNTGPQTAVTDASGTFTISNVQAGTYRVTVQHQNYPASRLGRVTKTLDVKPGETAGPLAVELTPGAVLSGHVFDEDGDPLPGCVVQPHPAQHPERGIPSTGGLSVSNEDGEFRASEVPPGDYIVSAHCQNAAFQPRPFAAGPDPPPSRAYPIEYYPLTTDIKAAQTIQAAAGSEHAGIDFRMKPATVTQVRGAFSPNGASWRGENRIMVNLIPTDQLGQNFGGVNSARVDLEKGTFEFRQVFPGSYLLEAFTPGASEEMTSAAQRINVGDQPNEIVLELRHATAISGTLEIESSTNTSQLTPQQVTVLLSPALPFGVPGASVQVNEDKTFTLKNVLPGVWNLQANAPFAFMKSATLASTDVTSSPIDLTSGSPGGSLRILMSTNTATIRGSAPKEETVFLERADTLENGYSRATQVNQYGQYVMDGLAPGKYRLTLGDPGSAMPDDSGQEVTVREGETVTMDLKAQ